jgi:predicted metal-binding protein
MSSDEALIQTTISSWEQVINRVGTLCLSCSEEQLLVEVAPGKNRISYLWGHLTAVNDAMFSVLRLGERLYPELDAVFIAQPDRSVPLQPPPRLPSGGRTFTPSSFRDSRLSALRNG